MMSGKDFLKSHVLSWRQKMYSGWEDVTFIFYFLQLFFCIHTACGTFIVAVAAAV